MNKFGALQNANAINNVEFEKRKGEIFDFVKDNFEPSYKDDTVDDYTFFIGTAKWVARYDKGIKCWLFFIGNELLINKYDEISDYYITTDGGLSQRYSYSVDEQFLRILHEEYRYLIDKLTVVQSEQEQGLRKISYPKEKRYGCISRKDFYNGMDEEQKKSYWAFQFSVDDIKYINKQPTIAPLTLREYFRLCRLYYLANPKDFKNVPDDPKEAYMRFADGRTEQMENVNLDDPHDFYNWVTKKGRWEGRHSIGHPYEITAKTYLQPHYTDGVNGYYVWRSFIWRYNEVATFCREPNLMLNNIEYLVDIICGKGALEVSPNINRYGYPNEKFQESVTYGHLTRKQKNKVIWNELAEAKIKQ